MTYFLLQHRYIRSESDDEPSFPAELVATIQFGPEDAFGVPGNPPRTTAKRAAPARLLWNPNEGVSLWEGEPIEAIKSNLTAGSLRAEWAGNKLTLKDKVPSMENANRLVLSANQILPAVLSFRLRVFVWIKEFLVDINGSAFRLETAHHRFGITIATTEHNQNEAIKAVNDWGNTKEHSLRLIMAMYYFRQAKRLAALEPDRQSMTAEVVLNLTKAIEVIFSSKRDRLREKAREWGFDSDFIEQKIVPLFLIRNELDVAHVASAPLTSEQHQSLIDFASMALSHVYTLLSRIVELEKSGQVVLNLISTSLDNDKEKLLTDIKSYTTSN